MKRKANMIGSDTKVIIAQVGGQYDSVEVDARICNSVVDLVNLIKDELSYNKLAMDSLLSDPRFVEALDQRGFRNVAKITNSVEKAKLETRFFIYQTMPYSHIRQIDINDDGYFGGEIAKEDNLLLQSVNKNSIKDINPKAYKQMKAAEKELVDQAKKKEERKQRKEAKKKEQELEAARKVLKDAGEIK